MYTNIQYISISVLLGVVLHKHICHILHFVMIRSMIMKRSMIFLYLISFFKETLEFINTDLKKKE